MIVFMEDFPGLITKSTKNNPTLAEDIRNLVKKNMTERDCILIVGDCGRDLQTIVGFNTEQKRTLCVLTKVDKCINDPELRIKLTKSLKNEGAISILHGFIALKNRLSDEKHFSIEECEKIEFSTLSSLDVPISNKGRSALIEKLTVIQNEHLEEIIPKQKELLNEELKKVELEIKKTPNNIRDYCSQGEEALIRLYDVVSSLRSSFKDFSENKEFFSKISTKEDMLQSVKANKLSLSACTTLIDELSDSLSKTLDLSTENDVLAYYEIVSEFIERGKGYPGLPDLYQPSIICDLTSLELAKMKEIVYSSVETVLTEIKRVLINQIVPKSVNSHARLEKLLENELDERMDQSFKQVQQEIEKLFRREQRRTFTSNEQYAHVSSLMKKLHSKKYFPDVKSKKHVQGVSFNEQNLEDKLTHADVVFVNELLKITTSQCPKHYAAIEIMIKFKSYMSIVKNRVADCVAQLFYDELIMIPVEHIENWLRVKRPINNSSTNSNYFSRTTTHSEMDTEQDSISGVPFNIIVEIMKPRNSEILLLKQLYEKRDSIKAAIIGMPQFPFSIK